MFAAGHIPREVRRPVAGRFENERITETNVCFWAKGVAFCKKNDILIKNKIIKYHENY